MQLCPSGLLAFRSLFYCRPQSTSVRNHVKGGGRPEQLYMGSGGIKWLRYYKRIAGGAKQGETKYQLLCANCNWMKRADLGIREPLASHTCLY